METTPYIFSGYHLVEIKLKKAQNENLNELRISMPGFHYDKEDEILSLTINVEIDYDLSKNNRFVYLAGFAITDPKLRADLLSNQKNDIYVPLFLSVVLPFIRENLMSITKDTGATVLLPTIDCHMITLNNTLVLTPAEK